LNIFGSKFDNIKYWDDPCRKKEILAYMIANVINGKVEIIP